jgi:hypothetical protein
MHRRSSDHPLHAWARLDVHTVRAVLAEENHGHKSSVEIGGTKRRRWSCPSPKRIRRRLGIVDRVAVLATSRTRLPTRRVFGVPFVCARRSRVAERLQPSAMRRIESRCASLVPMVKPTNFRERHHATFRRRLDASWRGRVLLEGEMDSRPMIIGNVAGQYAVAAQAWRRFAPRPQCPVCPTRREFEERPRAYSRQRSSSQVYEWSRSYSGGLDGSTLSAASTGGGATGDANARRCQGARQSGLCANPATRWRAAAKTVDRGGGVGDGSRCA